MGTIMSSYMCLTAAICAQRHAHSVMHSCAHLMTHQVHLGHRGAHHIKDVGADLLPRVSQLIEGIIDCILLDLRHGSFKQECVKGKQLVRCLMDLFWS